MSNLDRDIAITRAGAIAQIAEIQLESESVQDLAKRARALMTGETKPLFLFTDAELENEYEACTCNPVRIKD